ncbi:hypothetical protein M405DRAFT_835743 [Rhizopogon salebrosus TDB-379]|nr:hypothetical protein M405DRAFT_835743 [Rhizopogon salebrosus TDB-379]
MSVNRRNVTLFPFLLCTTLELYPFPLYPLSIPNLFPFQLFACPLCLYLSTTRLLTFELDKVCFLAICL